MRNVVLALAVLASGAVGAALMYLTERRIFCEEAAPDYEGSPRESLIWGRDSWIVCNALCCGAAAVFLAWFYEASTLDIVNLLLLFSVLWPCAWSDLQVKLIPNPLLLYGVLLRCGVLGAELFFVPQEILVDLVRSVVAAVALCGAALLCRLIVPGAVGFGDVKLLMVLGLFLGTDRAWSCVFFAMLAAFVYSLLLLLMKRANMKTEIPYAPFLLLGTILGTFLVSV